MKTDIGILITNIGSPDAPTPQAVRRYLKQFLSDPRVVQIPKWIWYPILYGVILPFRSKKSAKLYQSIWTDKGSPLVVLMQQLAEKLQTSLDHPVAVGMHYGNPSIQLGLEKLHDQHVTKIIVLPLYPQYSTSTTAATIDAVNQQLKSWRMKPEIQILNDYADHPAYIDAICQSIETAWQTRARPQHLLFSFHGLPKRFCEQGDPYEQRCKLTARLVAEKLNLPMDFWSVAFQSRLGRAEWLSPYTDQTLQLFPSNGIHNIDVICPGFAVDCLETLEEIVIRGKEQFVSAGGKIFNYIPALNFSDVHVNTLRKILQL